MGGDKCRSRVWLTLCCMWKCYGWFELEELILVGAYIRWMIFCCTAHLDLGGVMRYSQKRGSRRNRSNIAIKLGQPLVSAPIGQKDRQAKGESGTSKAR